MSNGGVCVCVVCACFSRRRRTLTLCVRRMNKDMGSHLGFQLDLAFGPIVCRALCSARTIDMVGY